MISWLVVPKIEPLHFPGECWEGEAGHPTAQPKGSAPHLGPYTERIDLRFEVFL